MKIRITKKQADYLLMAIEYYSNDSLEWNSSDYVHLLTEIERRAYADRAEYIGDTDFIDELTGPQKDFKYFFDLIKCKLVYLYYKIF